MPGAKLVFDEGADVTWPRLSPDGKRILYISFRDDASGQLCVRDLPDKRRRCLGGRRQRGAGAVDRQRRASRSSAATRSTATCASMAVDVGRDARGAHRSSSATSRARRCRPTGAGSSTCRSQRYVERVGPGFAARAAERLEAMRLDRPERSAGAAAARSAGADRAAGLLASTAGTSTSRSSSTTPTATATIDASDHGVLFRVPFESARDDAPARAAAAWPEQLTESTWNCQYPSPSATLLVATCSRRRQRARRLQPAARRPGAGRLERGAARRSRSASARARAEQTLLYRHLLSKQTTDSPAGGS